MIPVFFFACSLRRIHVCMQFILFICHTHRTQVTPIDDIACTSLYPSMYCCVPSTISNATQQAEGCTKTYTGNGRFVCS